MIGREKETKRLIEAYQNKQSKFIVVYGRRRVGKTYLVNETFKNKFTFTHTGLANATRDEQLQNFKSSLEKYGYETDTKFKSWFEAFDALAKYLTKCKRSKKVVFIDEMPWLDTAKSRFLTAFEHFWNGFASLRDDILLITSGSATSWMMNKVINNHGGLYNRISEQIYLRPFDLRECQLLMSSMKHTFGPKDILQLYMILGGIPYYWTLLQRGESLAQNIDELCFTRGGQLVNEFNRLYASLYRKPEPYLQIIETLTKKKKGLTRQEIAKETKMSDGGKLSQYLDELEMCDFVRKYRMFGRKVKGALYQIIDPFVLFYFEFMKNHTLSDGPLWTLLQGKPRYNTWCGLAFERVCLLHTKQIKQALGISGVISSVQSWHTDPKKTQSGEGTQIDMLIDRSDGIINVCEMKYNKGPYSIDAKTEKDLSHKIEMLDRACENTKGIHLTMITTDGVLLNKHSGILQSQVTLDQLFR